QDHRGLALVRPAGRMEGPTPPMIQVPESYRPFLDEGAVDPSAIAAVLPGWAPLPDFCALRERLGRHRLVTRVDAVEDDANGAPTLTFRAGQGEAALELFLRLEP